MNLGGPELAFILLIWGGVGAAIGSGKGKGGTGFLLGLLLGPIGWIITACLPKPSVLQKVQARPADAGWFHDPLGRFDARFFDGRQWTQHVGRVAADGSRQQFEDPT